MITEMGILLGEALKAQNILGAVRQNIFIGNNDIIDQGFSLSASSHSAVFLLGFDLRWIKRSSSSPHALIVLYQLWHVGLLRSMKAQAVLFEASTHFLTPIVCKYRSESISMYSMGMKD